MVFNIQEIDLAIIRYKTEIPHEEAKQQRPRGGGWGGRGKTWQSCTGEQPHNPPGFWPGQPLSKLAHSQHICGCKQSHKDSKNSKLDNHGKTPCPVSWGGKGDHKGPAAPNSQQANPLQMNSQASWHSTHVLLEPSSHFSPFRWHHRARTEITKGKNNQ